jgi:3-oxoadipate enol-lactonase
MPEVTLNGVEIFYEVLGREGPPVAFLNGIMMTTRSWVFQTALLRQRYRCILHDFRGQLLSGKPEEPFTMATHAEDLWCLLDHLGFETCHVVGTSYGGEVGMIFAATHPERVQSLAVISTVSYVGEELHQAVTEWADAALNDPDRLYRVSVPLNFSSKFLASSPDVVDQGQERVRSCPPEFFPAFARLVEAFQELDITERLPEITCPTLVMCGEEDALKPVHYSRTIAQSIPGAEFLIVPGAGHALVIENPAAVNTALLGFLEKHRGEEPRA